MENVLITETTKTTKGALITITGKLVLSKKVNLDGDIVKVDCCETRFDVSVAGHGSQGVWVRELTSSQKSGLPAGNEDKTHFVGLLVITSEQAQIIADVKSRIEALPQNKAHLAEIAKNEEAISKYESNRLANGYCPKCHSYCDGDCDA